jgi:GNAT superfamily N-acetyltransferase
MGGAVTGRVGNVRIREATANDREILLAYLGRLPEQDRRLRFFGPTDLEDQVDRMLSMAAGDAILGIVDDPEGHERCVAEGVAVPRGDGVAEFALSVDGHRRGGLGTAILEELRRRAAARGVTTLFGDVLNFNEPMLRLLRRRGGITIERLTADVVGIIVGTGDGPPPWPTGTTGRRVLIEASGGRWHGEDALRAEGYDVAVCHGPEGRAPDVPCPVLAGNSCSLVDGADVIVHLLPSDLPANQRVAAALADRCPSGSVLAPGRDAHRSTVEVAAVRRALQDARV